MARTDRLEEAQEDAASGPYQLDPFRGPLVFPAARPRVAPRPSRRQASVLRPDINRPPIRDATARVVPCRGHNFRTGTTNCVVLPGSLAGKNQGNNNGELQLRESATTRLRHPRL